MLKKTGSLVLYFFLFFEMSSVLAGSVQMQVEKFEAQVGETIGMELNVQGDMDGEPVIPQISDVEISSVGRSSSVSIVNGDITRSVILQYRITFLKEGDISIPPIQLKLDGRLEKTNSVKFKVSKVGAMSNDQIADKKPLFFIKRSLSTETPYVGEPVVEKLKIYRRIDWASAGRFSNDNPDLKYYEVKETDESSENVAGIPYRVTTLYRVFIPLKEGELSLGGFGIEVQYQDPGAGRQNFRDPFSFFRGSQLTSKRIMAPSALIGVNAVPQNGRPASFSGFVGELSLTSNLSTTKLKTGDTSTLTIEATGSGWLSSLKIEPPKFDPKLVKVYPDRPVSSETASRDGIKGGKTLKFAIVPVETGTIDLGDYELSYFNPVNKKFVTKKINLGSLSVEKGESVSLLSNAPSGGPVSNEPKNKITSSQSDIFDIKRDSSRGISYGWLSLIFVLLGSAFVIYALLGELRFSSGFFARTKSSKKNYLALLSAIKKSVRAKDRAKLYRSFTVFLSNETGIDISSVTFNDIERYFGARKIDTGTGLFRSLKLYEQQKYGSIADEPMDLDWNTAISDLQRLNYLAETK